MSTVLDATTADTYRMSVSPSTRTWDAFLPLQVPLVGPISSGWVLVRPLTLTVEFGEEALIVSDDVFSLYGLGNTVGGALQDFLTVLTGYYEVLSTHDDPETTKLFRYLQTYLQPSA